MADTERENEENRHFEAQAAVIQLKFFYTLIYTTILMIKRTSDSGTGTAGASSCIGSGAGSSFALIIFFEGNKSIPSEVGIDSGGGMGGEDCCKSETAGQSLCASSETGRDELEDDDVVLGMRFLTSG